MCRSGLAVKLGLMVRPTGKEGGLTLVDVGRGRPRRNDPGASALEKLLSACLPCGWALSAVAYGASECCPSQESFTVGSSQALEFWHASHSVHVDAHP